MRGGADIIPDVEEVSQIQKNNIHKGGKVVAQRGRSRKRGGRSHSSKLSAPKFMLLAEAVREGGIKQRRKRKGAQCAAVQSGSQVSGEGTQSNMVLSGYAISVVPETIDGLNLEVVLPGRGLTPTSGIDLLLNEENENHELLGVQHNAEAAKLLHLQQQVGFNYDE
ncbi:hypothetical protein A2U01_0048251, partial [Trifolium medium]|nr:hypothetical protein [Trifolium medium]